MPKPAPRWSKPPAIAVFTNGMMIKTEPAEFPCPDGDEGRFFLNAASIPRFRTPTFRLIRQKGILWQNSKRS
jgi:hypothetical protein